MNTATATQVVDSLAERVVPGIWTNGTVRRVLPRGLTRKQETLLLIYGATGPHSVADMVGSIEAPSIMDYRRMSACHSTSASRRTSTTGTARPSKIILRLARPWSTSELAEHL